MTDWSQVVQLYDQLLALQPSPIVELNRAVAIAELDGPEVALSIVERLDLASYHPWHVTRAELLRRLHRTDESRTAYDDALALIANDAERAHLTKRRDSL
jgi:RNA polymerase sigma-70 factor (ECF subfamily)